MVSPVAAFAAGHRTMHKTDLIKFDVLFRKLLRSAVGPPAGMDWTRPWHETLHDWNGRVNEFAALHGIKLWSERCVQQYWSLVHYMSFLEDHCKNTRSGKALTIQALTLTLTSWKTNDGKNA